VQGLDQRFTARAVAFMRRLLETSLTQVVQSEMQSVILPQFNGVYITDCTRLVWEASGMKLALRWELQRGQLQACLTELKQHDQKAAVVEYPLPAGALHLGDLGFFKLERFREWSAKGVFWLTRYKVGTQLYTLAGEAIDLKRLLERGGAGDEAETITLPVRVGSGRQPLRAQLIAARITPEGLIKRQARLKEQARLDQRPISQRQLDLMEWTIYLTHIPDLSFAPAHTLARTRWQIELMFKLWKSHGKVLHSRSADPLRQQCEGYAKLLGVIVSHWLLLVAGWEHDRLSAVDALRILRTHLPLLQRALVFLGSFADFFHWLRLDLNAAPRLSKRGKHPCAFQLWYALEDALP
jgi:hypothetical protein